MNRNELQYIYEIFLQWFECREDGSSGDVASGETSSGEEPEFFNRVFPPLSQILKAKACCLNLPVEDGEDAAQRALLKLVEAKEKKIFSPNGPSELFSWLRTVGTNHLFDKIKDDDRYTLQDPLDSGSQHSDGPIDDRTARQTLEFDELVGLMSTRLSEDELFIILRYARLHADTNGAEPTDYTYKILARELSLIRERRGDSNASANVDEIDHIIRGAAQKLVPLGIRLAKGENLHICPEPRLLSGPHFGTAGRNENFRTAPPRRKMCYYGHEINQYQFDWGVDSYGPWGGAIQPHSWEQPGEYIVRVRCRCVGEVVSSWYGNLRISIQSG